MGSEKASDTVYELGGTFALNDFVRFQYFHSLRRTWWFVIVVTLVVLVAGVLAAVLALVFHDSRTATYGSPILLLFLMWLGTIVVLPQSAARKQLRTGASLRDPINYTFSAQGIHSKSAFRRARHPRRPSGKYVRLRRSSVSTSLRVLPWSCRSGFSRTKSS